MGRMAEQQRKLLEQMMGPEAMGLFQQHIDWWDPKVCRNFLCGTCPHDVFGNTKMDLGPCPKMHSEKVATAFKAARAAAPADPRFAAFEQEYQNNLYAFIEDCDRKIRMSQRRLEKTPEENAKGVNLMREIGEIELAIQSETEEVESLGEAGKVEESMKKLEAVDALKAEKADKEKEMHRLTETGGASGHQKLRVCETCGAYLSILDSDRRLADHFGGKMHLGYHDLRKLLEEFAAQRQARLAAGPPPGAGAPGPGPGGPPGGGYRGGPPHMNGGPPGYPSNGHGAGPGPGPGPGYGAPPPSAPSAPRGAGSGPGGPPPPPPPPPGGPGPSPSTPHHPAEQDAANLVDAVLGSVPGHGDKRKREAAELAGDVRSERSRDEDRERRRHRSRDRDERHRSSDRDRDHRDYRDRERDGKSSRYDDDRRDSRSRHDDKHYDRERSSRTDRSDRDKERDRDRDRDRERDRDRDRDRSTRDRDDKPRRERERSRSPARK